MVFTGYCSNSELVKFLDFGGWKQQEIASYSSAVTYKLTTTHSDGQAGYLINGLILATSAGVTIDPDDYTVNLDTGVITFSTHPADESKVIFTYYLNREFDNDDISYYILLGANKLEKDTSNVFRETTMTYTTDGNLGYNYIEFTNKTTYISLPYPVLSVTSLTVDGVSVTPSTLKIQNNKVSLGPDSEVSYFSGEANTTTIVVKHGITDTVLDRSDEDSRYLYLAKEANKFLAAIMIYDSPIGRNVGLDNSYVVQKSDGSVRPELTVDSLLRRLETRYNELVGMMKSGTVHLV